MWKMVEITRGIAAISLDTINQGQHETKTTFGLIVWGNLLDLFVYEMEEMSKRSGTYKDVILLVQGHATSLM